MRLPFWGQRRQQHSRADGRRRVRHLLERPLERCSPHWNPGGVVRPRTSLRPASATRRPARPLSAKTCGDRRQHGHAGLAAHRDQYSKGLAATPKNLYSHSDQTLEWQSANPLSSGATGWGGRAIDVLGAASDGAFPPAVSVAGNSLLLTGSRTIPANLSPGNDFGLESIGGGRGDTARLDSLQEILTMDTGAKLVTAAGSILQKSFDNAKQIRAALAGAKPIQTVFPNTSLGSQMKQIAQIIAIRSQIGATRQVFFSSQGGYDHHTGLLAGQESRFAELGPALVAFYRATEELGVATQVTSFTASEFGRTFNPSSTDGSDHAWGSHHFVVGGGVVGGNMYGRFPALELQGPDDAGDRGTWIPSTSLDQYGATMASWFGVGSADLSTVFPNLGNFSTKSLGFV